MAEQSFENHSKMVPGYHYFTTLMLAVAVVMIVREAIREPNGLTLGVLLLSLAALGTAWYARVFALGVQDRVIRLEEQLRLARLLPEDLRGRIDDFTASQLIGMRFASDEELPELARRVLAGEFESRKAIKAAVKSWRADHQRV